MTVHLPLAARVAAIVVRPVDRGLQSPPVPPKAPPARLESGRVARSDTQEVIGIPPPELWPLY